MRGYLTVVLGLAMFSFITSRVLAILKAEKSIMLFSNLIGSILEIVMTILAIVFVWKI